MQQSGGGCALLLLNCARHQPHIAIPASNAPCPCLSCLCRANRNEKEGLLPLEVGAPVVRAHSGQRLRTRAWDARAPVHVVSLSGTLTSSPPAPERVRPRPACAGAARCGPSPLAHPPRGE